MPRVKLTPTTRAILWFLGAYVIVLMVLLTVRFLRAVH